MKIIKICPNAGTFRKPGGALRIKHALLSQGKALRIIISGILVCTFLCPSPVLCLQPPARSADALAPKSHTDEVLIALMVGHARTVLRAAVKLRKDIHQTYRMIMAELRRCGLPVEDVNVAYSRPAHAFNLQFVLRGLTYTVGYNVRTDTFFRLRAAEFDYFLGRGIYPPGFAMVPLTSMYEGVQADDAHAQVLNTGYRDIVKMVAEGASPNAAIREWLTSYGIVLSSFVGVENDAAIARAVNTAAGRLRTYSFDAVPEMSRVDGHRIFRPGADGKLEKDALVAHGEIIRAELPPDKLLEPDPDYAMEYKGCLTAEGRTKINPDLHVSALDALATWYQLLCLVQFAELVVFNRDVMEEHIRNAVADPSWDWTERYWLSAAGNPAAQEEWRRSTNHQKVAQVVAMMAGQYILERAWHDIQHPRAKKKLTAEEIREWERLKKIPGMGGRTQSQMPPSLRGVMLMEQPFSDAAGCSEPLTWLFSAVLKKSPFTHAMNKDVSHVLGTISLRHIPLQDNIEKTTHIIGTPAFKRLEDVPGFVVAKPQKKKASEELSLQMHAERSRWLTVCASFYLNMDFREGEFLALTADYAALPGGDFAVHGTLGEKLRQAGYDPREQTVSLLDLESNKIELTDGLRNDLLHFDFGSAAAVSDQARVAIACTALANVVENVLLGMKYGLIDVTAIPPQVRGVLGLNQMIDKVGIGKIFENLHEDFDGLYRQTAWKCLTTLAQPAEGSEPISPSQLLANAREFARQCNQELIGPRIYRHPKVLKYIEDMNHRLMLLYEAYCEEYRLAHQEAENAHAQAAYAADRIADEELLHLDWHDSMEILKVLKSSNFRRLGRVLGFTGLGPDLERKYADELAVAGHDWRVARITARVAAQCGLDSRKAKFFALTRDYAAKPFRHFAAMGELGERLRAAGYDPNSDIVESLKRDGIHLSDSAVTDITHFDISLLPPLALSEESKLLLAHGEISKIEEDFEPGNLPISDEAKIALACDTIEGVVEDILFGVRHSLLGFEDIHGDVAKALRLPDQFKWMDENFNEYEQELSQMDMEHFDELVQKITLNALGRVNARTDLGLLLERGRAIKELCRRETIEPYIFQRSNTPEAIEEVNRLILPHFEGFCEEYRDAHPGTPRDERVETLYAADRLGRMNDDDVLRPAPAVPAGIGDREGHAAESAALAPQSAFRGKSGSRTTGGRKISDRRGGDKHRAEISETTPEAALLETYAAARQTAQDPDPEISSAAKRLQDDILRILLKKYKTGKNHEGVLNVCAVLLEKNFSQRDVVIELLNNYVIRALNALHWHDKEKLARTYITIRPQTPEEMKKCLEALELDPTRINTSTSADYFVCEGDRAADHDQFYKAIDYYSKALQGDPKNVRARIGIARCHISIHYESTGEDPTVHLIHAAEWLSDALSLDPENPDLLRQLCEYYRCEDHYDMLMKIVLACLQREEFRPAAMFALEAVISFFGTDDPDFYTLEILRELASCCAVLIRQAKTPLDRTEAASLLSMAYHSAPHESITKKNNC